MKVICFGDSNTYGYDPRSWLGGRYDANSHWVDILRSQKYRRVLVRKITLITTLNSKSGKD